jgi:hypothetical protein
MVDVLPEKEPYGWSTLIGMNLLSVAEIDRVEFTFG